MPEGWNTLFPLESYTLSESDDKWYEKSYYDNNPPVSPHQETPFRATPFANDYTFRFAEAAVEGYHLGDGKYPDMLTISLSSLPDMIGHQDGPNPIEMEDTYLRLDRALSQFLAYMDERYGKEGYLLFFTADHGVNNAPGYLKDHRIPTGAVNLDSVLNEITMELQKKV